MLVLLGLRQGRCLAIFLNLGRIGQLQPTNNTVTTMNPKPPVKIKPEEPDQPNPNSPTPKPEQCRWEANCPICKNAEEDWDGDHQKQLQQTDKTLKHKIHSRSILPKLKIPGKPRLRTLSTPKTTGYHKTSPPRHSPSLCQTNMQNRYV